VADVETVVVPLPRLRRTTATEPLAIGLVHTSVLPLSTRRLPCRPPQSWLTPMTSVLVRIDLVAALMVRRSLPAIRGAFSSAQRLKWARDSVSDRPFPTFGSHERSSPSRALTHDHSGWMPAPSRWRAGGGCEIAVQAPALLSGQLVTRKVASLRPVAVVIESSLSWYA
jgi:hypothetical protein